MAFIFACGGQLAFCGRHFVHICSDDPDRFPTIQSSKSATCLRQGLTSFDIKHCFPSESKSNPDEVSISCIRLASDGNLLGVTDSDQNVYIFERNHQEGWIHKTSFQMETPIMRLQFDHGNELLILTDKSGNVYLSHLATALNFQKILGQCSLVLDPTISSNNKSIFNADQSNKIRCSKFPEAHQIQYFLSGHSNAIVGISVFNKDQNLLSIGIDGTIKLWDLRRQKCTRTWNAFQVCHGVKYVKPDEHQVAKLKLTEFYDSTYFVLMIDGTQEIPVFELHLDDKHIRQLGQVKMESEHCDIDLYRNILYTFNPEYRKVIKRFLVSSQGVLADPQFTICRIQNFSEDFEAIINQPEPVLDLSEPSSSEPENEHHVTLQDFLIEANRKIPRLIRSRRSRREREDGSISESSDNDEDTPDPNANSI